jgi:hypothetical protein
LVDHVYNYSLELIDGGYDENKVTNIFAGIDAIVVPSCVDAGEILYYFRLLRDTLSACGHRNARGECVAIP